MPYEPTLSASGLMSASLDVVRTIIANYLVVDPNQSSLLPSVKCFIVVTGKHNNEPQSVASVVRDDLKSLISSVISDASVDVSYTYRLNEYKEQTSSYDLSIVVTSSQFSPNADQSKLSFSGIVKNGFVDNFIYNYTED